LFSDLFAAIVSEDLDELGDNSPTISSKAGQKTTVLPFLPCRVSVTFLCGSGSGSPDPYIRLMDPDPALDPTQDPTPFFNDFKDIKENFFIFFCL
jgi:hypothetical protein